MIQGALFEHVRPRAPRPQVSKQASKPVVDIAEWTRRQRYGDPHGNVSLFAAPARQRARRKARVLAPHPIAEKDPFGEWVDAHAWEHQDVLWALEHLPNDYDASCGYLRAHRPRTSGPALQFWNAPLSRAHAINALLNRGNRSVVQVHLDCDLGEDKLYTYAERWKMTFDRPDGARDALLIDRTGARHTVIVVNVNRQAGTAQLRVQGYLLTLTATYDPRSRVYRTPDALMLDTATLLSYEVCGHLLNMTPALLAQVLPPDLHTERGVPLLYQRTLERLAPRHTWRRTLEDAMNAANPCRCIFFDHHNRRCGVELRRQLPQAGTASYACEDHTP